MTSLALTGYGSVARALQHLVCRQRSHYSFRITGVHILHYGTVIRPPRSAARSEHHKLRPPLLTYNLQLLILRRRQDRKDHTLTAVRSRSW